MTFMKLTANENIDRIFLVKKAEVKTTKNGKQYLDLQLVDKENDVSGKMWDWDDSKPTIEPMTLQRIVGTVGEYGGQPQITVKDIEPVDESTVDMSEYVP